MRPRAATDGIERKVTGTEAIYVFPFEDDGLASDPHVNSWEDRGRHCKAYFSYVPRGIPGQKDKKIGGNHTLRQSARPRKTESSPDLTERHVRALMEMGCILASANLFMYLSFPFSVNPSSTLSFSQTPSQHSAHP